MMPSDPPGPKRPPPSNAPPGQGKAPGTPGVPIIKKGPHGWQLPIDPAMRAEPRRPRIKKPLPRVRRFSAVLIFGFLMLAVLAGCLLHWRESIEIALQQRVPRTHAKVSGLPARHTAKPLPATPHIPSAILSAIASPGKTVRHPPVASAAISSKPVSDTQTASTIPIPITPGFPAPTGEAEAFHQTLAEYSLLFAGKPRPLDRAANIETLYNRAYAVGYSDAHREAVWVGYRLDRTAPGGTLPRPKKFTPDDRLLSRVTPKEYTHSGYDRGHLAPNSAIARRFGAEAQLETFLMSNIAPQRPALNRNVWQRLERLEDSYADRFDQLYILTGPIFDDRREVLSESSDVEIPDEFYKILLDEDDGRVHILAFRIPQTVSGREPLEQYLTSVDDIEQATDFDFFWALSDPLESRIEAEKPQELWGTDRNFSPQITQAE